MDLDFSEHFNKELEDSNKFIKEYFKTSNLDCLREYFTYAEKLQEATIKYFKDKLKIYKVALKDQNHKLHNDSKVTIPKIKKIIQEYNSVFSSENKNKLNEFYTNSNSVLNFKNETTKIYNDFIEEFKLKNQPAEYVMFYESPPPDINNYILNDPVNSQYCTILKRFFEKPTTSKLNELLLEKNCLFIDILDIPIEISVELRSFWSKLYPPFPYVLFRNKIEYLIQEELINSKTKIAIGMPPNTSLGIYNFLPWDQNFFIHHNMKDLYLKLVIGNDDINNNTSKLLLFKRTKFNSHKSNVFYHRNPNLEMLKHAWS
jgi:hypothetical protein